MFEKIRYKKIFEQDIIPLYEDLYRYLLKLGCEPIIAEDMIQEVMQKAWENIRQLEPIEYKRQWLFTVARNQYYSYTRLVFHKYEYSDGDVNMLDYECSSIEEDVAAILVRQESMEVVETALRQLPDKYAALIRMRYFGELSHQEIAEELSIKPGTVRSMISRGLTKLKPILIAKGIQKEEAIDE